MTKGRNLSISRKLSGSISGLVLGLSMLLLVLLGCDRGRPRRMVLVVIDTLRADAFFGTGDNPEGFMPRTRARASKGRIFRNFYAATSTTQPSHATMFTGLHPWEHGVTKNGQILEDHHQTLAEFLQSKGYETSAVVASKMVRARAGFNQGFDSYREEFRKGVFGLHCETVTDLALQALDDAESRKQFFWFHYLDPHSPYGGAAAEYGGLAPHERALSTQELEKKILEVPPRRMQKIVAGAFVLYQKDVGYLDRSLVRLFDRLSRDEKEFETHIVLVADHGESFGESRSLGHGNRLTREQVKVPFFILSPRLAPGETDHVAGSIDIPATLLSLLGIEDHPFAGRDLSQPADGAGMALGMRQYYPGMKVRVPAPDGSLKLEGEPRFYTVEDGVLLSGNTETILEGDLPRKVRDDPAARRAREMFRSFRAELEKTVAPEATDDETRAALKALGYIEEP